MSSDPGQVRVLRIITTLELEVGGPSQSAVNAAVAEQAFGVVTTIVATRRHGAEHVPIPALQQAGVTHLSFPRIRRREELAQRWGISPSFLWWIMRNVRRFDVVHVHYVWPLGTLLGAGLGKALGKPVVMTPHESLTSFDIDRSRSTWRLRQKKLMRAGLLRCVSQVVTASDLERRDSGLSEKDATVIAHPVPASGARELPAPPDVTVGYLGRLHPKKRVELLLEAVALLPDEISLLVGGNQPESELHRLQSLSETLKIDHRVIFIGFVPRAERDDFLARLSVLAMPSTYECFGMVAAEALSADIPVIVTEKTGISETVGRRGSGEVVPHEDPAAIAQAITTITADGRQAEFKAAARISADVDLSLAHYGCSIHRLYRALPRAV